MWEYVFFVDVLGHREDDRVAEALEEIGSMSGAYLQHLIGAVADEDVLRTYLVFAGQGLLQIPGITIRITMYGFRRLL